MTPSCHSRSSRWITILGGFGQMGFAGAGSHVFQRAPGETLEALSARAVAVAETANERVVVIQGWSPEMDGWDGLDEDDWRAACAEHEPLPAPPVLGIEGLSTAAVDSA